MQKPHLRQKLLRVRMPGKDESLRTLDIHFKQIDSRQHVIFHEFADGVP